MTSYREQDHLPGDMNLIIYLNAGGKKKNEIKPRKKDRKNGLIFKLVEIIRECGIGSKNDQKCKIK